MNATGISIKSIPMILIIIGVYLLEFKRHKSKNPMKNYNICKKEQEALII